MMSSHRKCYVCGTPADGECQGTGGQLAECPRPGARAVELRGMLTYTEARALAQLCKRITWSDCAGLSVDREETQLMIDATNAVRRFLEQAGVAVR